MSRIGQGDNHVIPLLLRAYVHARARYAHKMTRPPGRPCTRRYASETPRVGHARARYTSEPARAAASDRSIDSHASRTSWEGAPDSTGIRGLSPRARASICCVVALHVRAKQSWSTASSSSSGWVDTCFEPRAGRGAAGRLGVRRLMIGCFFMLLFSLPRGCVVLCGGRGAYGAGQL